MLTNTMTAEERTIQLERCRRREVLRNGCLVILGMQSQEQCDQIADRINSDVDRQVDELVRDHHLDSDPVSNVVVELEHERVRELLWNEVQAGWERWSPETKLERQQRIDEDYDRRIRMANAARETSN